MAGDENPAQDSNASDEHVHEDPSVKTRVIEDEMRQSYLDYAMSVIVSRALPDARDGLKPVHRRVLYAMHDMGIVHNKPFKKSARIVGEVLGKYHPHGDTAVYDTLVRMAQDFSLRYPLIDGQGNFGSIDGDNAAAMRYTEARMQKIAEEMLSDIDKETVDFRPNFSAEFEEPVVLPAKVPNLLINGTTGIAVGMATNMPPHNLGEVCDGVIHVVDNPECSDNDLLELVKGPDFPTAGLIMGDAGIKLAYKTGRGKVKVRARVEVEEYKKDRERIIIHEMPYMVNKAQLLEAIAHQVKEGVIEGISDLRDESDRDGIRAIIELKKDANAEVVLNQLWKHSRMQVTFGINNLALVDNIPLTLSLKSILTHFVEHRKNVVRRRTEFELKKAEDKAHILEGLVTALDDIDNIIALIKQAKSGKEAKEALMQKYYLSDKQSQAILDMRLQRLTALEQDKLRADLQETMDLIKRLKAILADPQKILNIIKDETAEIKEKYANPRRTEIVPGDLEDVNHEDLIEAHAVVVTKSHKGYIKRLPLDTYKSQGRGGKGIIAATTTEEDFIEDIFVANTHSYILFFSDKGKVYWKKVYDIPESGRTAKGKPVVNLIQMDPDEKITTMIPIKEFNDDHYLFFATRNGIVKKTQLSAFARPRKGGIIAVLLEGDDKLVNVRLTDGNKTMLVATRNGVAIHFDEKDTRAMGRASRGVRGIKLKNNDRVISLNVVEKDTSVLTITENGFGKRTAIEDYRTIGRGGMGVINIISNDRNGPVVSVSTVHDTDEVMFISKNGIAIRTEVQNISVIGRNTQGMRLMRLKDNDSVVSAAKIVTDSTEIETDEPQN